MTYTVTPQILEILASRICHDLISPVSAVNNGVEFWEEMGAEAGDEAIGLIGPSATQASNRLQLFRFAYAAGGSESHVTTNDVRDMFAKFIEGGRINLIWNISDRWQEGKLAQGFCKTLLNFMLVASDMLPRGGEIKAETQDDNKAILLVSSENMNIQIDYKDVLDGKGKPDKLTTKTIHPYVTIALAQEYGLNFAIDGTDSGLQFSLSFNS